MKKYRWEIIGAMLLKLLGSLGELSLPYILEHIIDDIVPSGVIRSVIIWGLLMIVMSFLTRFFNVSANRWAVSVSKRSIFTLRSDLFRKVSHLSGSRFDAFSLPSLTSRMTSDSYNVQNFMTRMQTLGIRAPIMMIGGIVTTLSMDMPLAMVLVLMVPVALTVVLSISYKGTPLFDRVQQRLDDVVRVMRENISGIRVVKALSREEYERKRYYAVNDAFTKEDIHASTIMALPGPFMELCLNVGLTIVVFYGAVRVNGGQTQPGVILAFLTYFNLILMSCRALNRIFVLYSKAKASADRIAVVLHDKPDQLVLTNTCEESLNQRPIANAKQTKGSGEDVNSIEDERLSTSGQAHIQFRHVSFSYAGDVENKADLTNIDFKLNKGESLGILGATGSGKTTVINLLMRFYDAQKGEVLVNGRDIRSYDKDELRRHFGVAFQNDIIFADTLRENIEFGRKLTPEQLQTAIEDSRAAEFIGNFKQGLGFKAEIKGANLSGGQKQRILVARALAGNPDILILDDSSSALDYQTDAAMRKGIREDYGDSTLIMVAQRISSVMGLDHIMVLDDGKCIAYGTHDELMETCEMYADLYRLQMGHDRK